MRRPVATPLGVVGEGPAARRYLVIAPGTPTATGAPVQIQQQPPN
jgi:hypothetical protein